MFLLPKAIYTIVNDKIIFKNKLEYISNIDIYETIAYILPIALDINVLIIFGGTLTIIPVANKII